VTIDDFGYPVIGPFIYLLPKTFKLFGFPIFLLRAYLMKVIPGTYLMKVIPGTHLMKVIPGTYLTKVIPGTYLMNVIPGTRHAH
jgi:hypothetical protein